MISFSNIKLTFRNFRKQKLFTTVNLAGLTIGIISATLILVYIGYEKSYDRFNKNADRIYRLYSTFTMSGANQEWITAPTPLASFLKNKFSPISSTVRIAKLPKGLISSDNKSFFEEKIILADSSIFEVFTFPLKVGDPKTALAQPNSLLLTEATAKKYFGNTDPIGKILRYNREISMTVTGIVKDIPGNSHLQYDMILPMSAAKTFLGSDFLINPMNTSAYIYLLINKNSDIKSLDKSISESAIEYRGGDFGDNLEYHIQALTSIHLYSAMGGEFSQNNDIRSIYILATIAFLILVIACINYINLSYSILSIRSTELGMRKIMGATKIRLILLFVSDVIMLLVIAAFISILIFHDLLPWFGNLLGVDLNNIKAINLIPAIAFLALIITTVTTIASAVISSRINPMDTLRKTFSHKRINSGTQGLLVLFQFGISVILIFSSVTVYRQMHFIRDLNLGFKKEQLMIIPLNDKKVLTKLASFKLEILSNPNILSASATSDLPGEMKWVASVTYDGVSDKDGATMTYLEIDKDFAKTYGVKLKEGYMPEDTACHYSGTHYLLNGSAVKKLGWKNPVGQKFSSYNGKDGFITGVIDDFHFKTLHKEIEPLFLYLKEGGSNYLALKLNQADMTGTVRSINKTWNNSVPDSPFEYFFYDNYYQNLYKKEALFGKIIFIFSVVAIFIACMGLFSLTAFYSGKRTKEVGLRKVSGAVVTEIIILLNRDFIKWVIISLLFALPVAWYAMHRWLEGFAYKTELSWGIFAISAAVVLGIALITVSWQSWRAATRNPVEALRYE
jgi:putative ABC transport system permease protein